MHKHALRRGTGGALAAASAAPATARPAAPGPPDPWPPDPWPPAPWPAGDARPACGAAVAGPAAGAGAAEVFRQLDEKIIAGMRRHHVPGAAVGVLYQGREHLRGFGVTNVRHPVPVDARTLFRVGSTSKTLTGTAIMMLADAGRLDLDTEVGRILPGFRAPAGAAGVTVRQLLSHSAGWLGDVFRDTGRGAGALARYVAALAELPQLTQPGSVFSYNNAALIVAGRVLEQVTGLPYEYAIRDLLLTPLRMTHSFFFSDEIIGYNVAAPHATVNGEADVLPPAWRVPRSINAAGGLTSSAADLLRWARFHLGDGAAPDGSRLLSPRALTAMRSRPGPGGTIITELTGMGVTWMVRPTAQGVPVIQHGGHWPGEVSGFLLVPAQRAALVLLTNSESASPLVNELFAKDWALRLLCGLTNLPAPERHLSAAELAPYLGTYTLQQVDSRGRLTCQPPQRLTARDGGLCLTTGDGPPTLLTFYESPYGPDYVLVRNVDGSPRGTRADFLRDASGRVAWLRLHGRLHRHLS